MVEAYSQYDITRRACKRSVKESKRATTTTTKGRGRKDMKAEVEDIEQRVEEVPIEFDIDLSQQQLIDDLLKEADGL